MTDVSAFGFGAVETNEKEDSKPKEVPHRVMDTLKYTPWSEIKVGLPVQSVLTETKGKVSHIDEKYEQYIQITWDNGNVSCARKDQLAKVIVL